MGPFEATLVAFQDLLAPLPLLALFTGTMLGLFLGAIPGVGGLTAIIILLPFAFEIDVLIALPFVIGLAAAGNTADSIPSILFGVPGNVASQATILDGHPLALRGQAGRAFGATYMSSMIGGLAGAATLAILIPAVKPIVLLFGSPELFAIGLFGLTMVASLSSKAIARGLIAAAVGLLLGMIGGVLATGFIRWNFEQLYLWDGIPIIVLAIGLFGIPEMIDLSRKRSYFEGSSAQSSHPGMLLGMKEALRHKLLVFRSSMIGVLVGLIPGLGGQIVDWLAYGQALQTEKGARESFGRGDIRGVIAPEAAANSKEGGALLPTFVFGIPGSLTMAFLISILMTKGIQPGPRMIRDHLDTVYLFVWGLALANVFSTSAALLLTNQLRKVVSTPPFILAPIVTAIAFISVYQATSNIWDIHLVMIITLVGWTMKRLRWPRPPLLIGYIMSPIIEQHLFIAVQAHGASFVIRPAFIMLSVLISVSIFFAVRMTRARSESSPLDQAAAGAPAREE